MRRSPGAGSPWKVASALPAKNTVNKASVKNTPIETGFPGSALKALKVQGVVYELFRADVSLLILNPVQTGRI